MTAGYLSDFSSAGPFIVALGLFCFMGFALARWWTVLVVPVVAALWLLSAVAADGSCDPSEGECNGPEIILYLAIAYGIPMMLATGVGVGIRKLMASRMARRSPG